MQATSHFLTVATRLSSIPWYVLHSIALATHVPATKYRHSRSTWSYQIGGSSQATVHNTAEATSWSCLDLRLQDLARTLRSVRLPRVFGGGTDSGGLEENLYITLIRPSLVKYFVCFDKVMPIERSARCPGVLRSQNQARCGWGSSRYDGKPTVRKVPIAGNRVRSAPLL